MTTSSPGPLTLRKDEKLRHKHLIDALFGADGRSVYAYPLRVQYRSVSADSLQQAFRKGVPPRIGALQMLITVPKRRMRHAVDRVLLRRRIREAYRLNRADLKQRLAERADVRTLSMSFVYIGTEKCSYQRIERAMKTLLQRIADEM